MNILMNNGKTLIADFSVPNQKFSYLNHNIIDKKSAIYSLGVLLWELISEVPPFNGSTNLLITAIILQNKREKIIANTPTEYANICTKCFSFEPDQCPSSNEIKISLEKLSTEIITTNVVENNVIINNDVHMESRLV
ncbi:kinase-like protein [Gigaspora margarita]|uniref:Kinase-like protein n=1 Tax=Gigaspora margarita TaxID=4874 RepID=A0A8H3X466_GIGMA|nr:kinase-like protein [Gigaspora margarita]